MVEAAEKWHFIILKFEFSEYLRKNRKTLMKNQPNFEIFLKYIENSDFFEEYIHYAPISDLCHI